MPGHHHTDRRRGADVMSRVAALLWLVTAISVLQWSAPALDPALFQRLAGGSGDAGLATGDRAAAAVVEARATPSIAVAEKRAAGTRLLAAGGDDAGLTASGIVQRPANAFAAAVPAGLDSPRLAAARRAFSARSPPAAA